MCWSNVSTFDTNIRSWIESYRNMYLWLLESVIMCQWALSVIIRHYLSFDKVSRTVSVYDQSILYTSFDLRVLKESKILDLTVLDLRPKSFRILKDPSSMDLLELWNSRRKNTFAKAADIDDRFFLKSFIIIVNEDYYYEHIRFVVNYNEFLGLSHYRPPWKYSPHYGIFTMIGWL